ncbi:Colicin V production protein [Aminomonas paucivorans DSM 12260]|uniref:Colicin V production protein n=1 Tax=Aminomonas paucivorans DSM 12260 TaxID=584708 RepID=E3CXW3_9BACT|nr:CvpA family protein [Aminomonas paucivorans]EFQ23573.1 Colicin V production protein [Aminomonas paucivorans DSM 12260]
MTSPVDYLVAAAGAFWILKGLFRGFAGEVLSLLGWVLGVFAGLRFGGGRLLRFRKAWGWSLPLPPPWAFWGCSWGVCWRRRSFPGSSGPP